MCGECNWPMEDKKREELTLPYLKGPGNDWVSIEHKLPAIGRKVRVKNSQKEEDAVFLQRSWGFFFKIGIYANQIWEPTHWKPLGNL